MTRGRSPQAPCGLPQLQWPMQAPRASALEASLPHARAYRHSRASVRFMRSTLPFCQGLKGLVCLCLTPRASRDSLKRRLR